MAADTVANPQTGSKPKSGSKKKAKSEASAAGAQSTATASSSVAGTEQNNEAEGKLDGTGTYEHPYLKELQKSIRNINKKLNATQKVDSIVAENPGVSLNDLVSSRKINNDQKAQALKKPGLQAQLADLEERVGHYKKFAQEYQDKFEADKEQIVSAHSTELQKTRETARAEVVTEFAKDSKTRLLTLSRFLRAAAARRQLEDDDSEISKAFEGALLLVYGGDMNAVNAAEKLIDGAAEAVPSTEGVFLNVTYEEVRQTALNEAPVPEEDTSAEAVAPPADTGEDTASLDTDPTVANAGLTELSTATQVVNGTDEAETPSAPPTGATGDEAANAAGEAQWDIKAPGQDAMSASAESFEMVPRNPAETETTTAPMPTTSTQSWADEIPDKPTTTQTPVSGSNDGFHEVHHGRGGRGRGGFQGERGGYRGRGGPRGDGRGRGNFRGDYRGRGRGGGFRGGRGGRDGSS